MPFYSQSRYPGTCLCDEWGLVVSRSGTKRLGSHPHLLVDARRHSFCMHFCPFILEMFQISRGRCTLFFLMGCFHSSQVYMANICCSFLTSSRSPFFPQQEPVFLHSQSHVLGGGDPEPTPGMDLRLRPLPQSLVQGWAQGQGGDNAVRARTDL